MTPIHVEKIARDVGLWVEPFTPHGTCKAHNQKVLEFAKALAALWTQPERKRSIIWGKSPVLINGMKFEVVGDGWFLQPEDGFEYEISTAQPDHSEQHLGMVDALEGKV